VFAVVLSGEQPKHVFTDNPGELLRRGSGTDKFFVAVIGAANEFDFEHLTRIHSNSFLLLNA
jgi:hypothetical protein